MVVGTKDGIVMVESGAKECSEEASRRSNRIRSRRDQEDRAPALTTWSAARARPSARSIQIEVDVTTICMASMQRLAIVSRTRSTHRSTPSSRAMRWSRTIKDELKKDLPEGDSERSARSSASTMSFFAKTSSASRSSNDRIRPDHRAFDQIRHIDRLKSACTASRPRFRALHAW